MARSTSRCSAGWRCRSCSATGRSRTTCAANACGPAGTTRYYSRFSRAFPGIEMRLPWDNHLSEAELAQLHKRVWLHGGVPLLYVAWPARLDILTCARGPDFWQSDRVEYRPADQIREAIAHGTAISEALEERYSAW